MSKQTLINALGIVGFGLIAAGAMMLSVPAGLITIGSILLALAITGAIRC